MKEISDTPEVDNLSKEDLEEAAENLASSYRVVRRIAGQAIIERDRLKEKALRVEAAIENARIYGGDVNLLIADLEEALDTPSSVR